MTRGIQLAHDRYLAPLVTGAVGAVAANQLPQNQRSSKKAKQKVEEVFKSDNQFAQRMYDLVMKMDEETARTFTTLVVASVLEETIEKNQRTLQRHLDDVVAKRTARVKKALLTSVSKGADQDALAYAQALARIEKAVQWDADEHPRGRSGQFRTKVHFNPHATPLDSQQMAGLNIPQPEHLDEAHYAQYQQEHQQVTNFLDSVKAGSDTHKRELRVQNKKTGRQHLVDLPNKLKAGQHWDPETERIVEVTATPTGLSLGGAAFGLTNALGSPMSDASVKAVNRAATEFPNFARDWNNTDDLYSSNARLYENLKVGSHFLSQVAPNGSQAQIAGKFGEFIGSHGAEAEKVIGPHARRTAYRYRGTERTPDSMLLRDYRTAMRSGQQRDLLRSERARQSPGGVILTPDQNADLRAQISEAKALYRDQLLVEANRKVEESIPTRGHQIGESGQEKVTRNFVQLRDIKVPKDKADQIEAGVRARFYQGIKDEQARSGATAAGMVGGRDVLINYLNKEGVRPNKRLFGLHLDAGHTPPSEGFLINSRGQISAQAVGYGDDHYLPFNLKNLAALKGGEYVRSRSVGGPTSEDIYTGLVSGARQITVVSRSGVFTVKFKDDFRGGRRYNDKAARMVSRYQQLLDSVQSGQVDRQPIRPEIQVAITDRVREKFRGAPAMEIHQEIQRSIEQYKQSPELDAEHEAAINDFVERQKERGEPSDKAERLRAEMLSDARNDKEFKFRLNGDGYAAALDALQEQFPYYIESYPDPRPDPELKTWEPDKGYVEPGRLRPTQASAGWHGVTQGQYQHKGQKYSASDANFQRGKYGTASDAPRTGKLVGHEEPKKDEKEELDENGQPKKATDSKKLNDIRAQMANNQYREQFVTSAKAIHNELRARDYDGSLKRTLPLVNVDSDAFETKIKTTEGEREFEQMMKANNNFSGQIDDKLIRPYLEASSRLNRLPYDPERAAAMTGPPPLFDGDAYKPKADPIKIQEEVDKIDRRTQPLTSDKKLSELNDASLKTELDAISRLHSNLEQIPESTPFEDKMRLLNELLPPGPRLNQLANDKKGRETHLKDIHRMRALNLERTGDRTAAPTPAPSETVTHNLPPRPALGSSGDLRAAVTARIQSLERYKNFLLDQNQDVPPELDATIFDGKEMLRNRTVSLGQEQIDAWQSSEDYKAAIAHAFPEAEPNR